MIRFLILLTTIAVIRTEGNLADLVLKFSTTVLCYGSCDNTTICRTILDNFRQVKDVSRDSCSITDGDHPHFGTLVYNELDLGVYYTGEYQFDKTFSSIQLLDLQESKTRVSIVTFSLEVEKEASLLYSVEIHVIVSETQRIRRSEPEDRVETFKRKFIEDLHKGSPEFCTSGFELWLRGIQGGMEITLIFVAVFGENPIVAAYSELDLIEKLQEACLRTDVEACRLKLLTRPDDILVQGFVTKYDQGEPLRWTDDLGDTATKHYHDEMELIQEALVQKMQTYESTRSILSSVYKGFHNTHGKAQLLLMVHLSRERWDYYGFNTSEQYILQSLNEDIAASQTKNPNKLTVRFTGVINVPKNLKYFDLEYSISPVAMATETEPVLVRPPRSAQNYEE